ncbi:MAG: 50S ribosomal protein L11 methyltransferase [Alphaproteobacteria bacterium]
MTDDDVRSFIRNHTAVTAPPLVPELKLHLATEITPLWQATETWLSRQGIEPPYWAFPWVGGQALARFVLDHPAYVRGQRVLDFGAGSGLVALAAARCGAEVTASDLDPVAGAAITLNAALNDVAVEVAIEDAIDREGPWSVVLAGDMFYERRLAERAWPWLLRLAGQGVSVFLGDPGRAFLPSAGLLECARYSVPTSKELEDREVREVRVWRVSP